MFGRVRDASYELKLRMNLSERIRKLGRARNEFGATNVINKFVLGVDSRLVRHIHPIGEVEQRARRVPRLSQVALIRHEVPEIGFNYSLLELSVCGDALHCL